MERTRLAGHFERIICSHDLAAPKESTEFWSRVQKILPFDPERTLFVDDSPGVLRAARDYGFRWLLAILEPDSRAPRRSVDEFPAVANFEELLPSLRAGAGV
jgi:putative hydrolase of the HAD superfamily